MSNNNNNQSNTKVKSFAFYCRWWAFCRKHGATNKEKGATLVSSQPDYIRRWLIDGEGTPYATITNADVGEAISLMESEGFTYNQVLGRVAVDVESQILLLEYCLSIS